MQLPLKGACKITTLFGQKGNWACGFHTGIDLVSMENPHIYPIAAGQVEYISTSGSYGNHIRIKHENGMVSLYAHLESIEVKKWQMVYGYSILGKEGSTGNSTGKHLHLEIHQGAYYYPIKGSKPESCKWLLDPCAVLGIKKQLGLVKKEEADMIYYEALADIPQWGKDTVEKLLNQNYLQGTEAGNLHLSEDMLRTLIILDRAGQFGA